MSRVAAGSKDYSALRCMQGQSDWPSEVVIAYQNAPAEVSFSAD